jgi:hypothetical protein
LTSWRVLAHLFARVWDYGWTSDSMQNGLEFEAWKTQLRENCSKEGKLFAFNLFEDFVLLLLFERGVEPTPGAIIGNERK